MFTGIVAAVGNITSVSPLAGGLDAGVRLEIDAGGLPLADVALGDSIAINGACMTVVEKRGNAFAVDVSRESLNKTAGLDAVGEVNLEKALTLAERLGGHLVSGHVDGLGTVHRFQPVGESHELVIDAPQELAKFLAYKGSVVVNGVSLTVNRVEDLAEDGKLDLEAKLVDYFPECTGGGKEAITIRHLLTHTSGLAAGLPAKPAWSGDAAAHALACAQTVTHAPGSFFRYSDINYILLGQLVHKVAGKPLDVFAQERIFAPLGMRDTGYLPLRRVAREAIAPTQKTGAADSGNSGNSGALDGDVAAGALLQGVVHDPTVRRIGGVAGSAGVFTTARDVARFGRMLLGNGSLDGVRILSPESVRLLTTVQSPPGIAALRGLGMDIDSPFAQRPRGTLYPVGSFGHTGFTGCILWIDPASRSFYVFLSNRVYPDDKANVLPLYTQLGTLAAEAAGIKTGPARSAAAAP